MNTLASLGQVRMRAIALLAVMFIAGALAGAGVSRMVDYRHRPPRPPWMGPFGELGLTAEQDARVRAVFEKHRPELDAILAETRPKVREVQKAIDDDLSAILTPEQLHKLQQLKGDGRLPPPSFPPGLGPHGAGPAPGLLPPPPIGMPPPPGPGPGPQPGDGPAR